MFKKFRKEWSERLLYDGYTYEEICSLAGGGGKSAPAPEAAKPINTTTTVGNLLDAAPATNTTDTTKKDKTIDKAKMGTRGLQIPVLQTTAANPTTTTKPTAANTGIQI